MNKPFEEIKKELVSNGYKYILATRPEHLRKFISTFEPSSEELIEIHDALFFEEAQKDFALLNEKIYSENDAQNNKILWTIKKIISNQYLPGYLGSKTILELIIRSNLCRVLSRNNTSDVVSKDTLWDLFVIKGEKLDPGLYAGYTYSFQCIILNDFKYFDASYFAMGCTCQYPTGKRFSGLLAHLYYSNFIDLYNNLFDILLETIRKHFDVTMPLPLFLYNFCLENDKEKADSVKLIIDEFKNANPDYNWNKELKDCYAYSIAKRCVVGNPNLKIKEIMD